jgi:type I restriction enzyme M protein
MVQTLSPKLGESIADFACGTGGFLTSTLKELEKQVSTVEDRRLYNDSIYGIDKKPLPYLLTITNMLIHDVDSPQIIHGNSLERNVREFKDSEKFNVVLMNPPYGGTEGDHIKSNFPADLRTSETADLFMSLIMYRLKRDGRAAVIIPDGFLFGVDNAKTNIKSKLFSEFNVHTIVRMPHSVFAPYTSIRTNIVFFDNSEPTKETWFYRLDIPKGYKNFSKTKPMQLSHFDEVVNWWNNRHVIELDGFSKANKYSMNDISEKLFNIDLCGFPHEEQVVLDPLTTIENYRTERSNLSEKIDAILNLISSKLGEGQ